MLTVAKRRALATLVLAGIKAFDESQHPRDEHGRWASDGGESSAQHAQDVLAHLPADQQAHVASLGKTIETVRTQSGDTQAQHDHVNGVLGNYTPEREAMHQAIISDILAKNADVPNEHQALILGGLGGAGKTSLLGSEAGHEFVGDTRYMSINPDDIKAELISRGAGLDVPGVQPMEASPLIHEESSDIARQLGAQAADQGKNVAWDITMASSKGAESRLNELDAHGYTTRGVFVDVPVNTSIDRAVGRWQRGYEAYQDGHGYGGRWVPPSLIAAQADPSGTATSQNEAVFQSMTPRMADWAIYDNSGATPRLESRKS